MDAAELRIMRRDIGLLRRRRLGKAHVQEERNFAEGIPLFDYKCASLGSATQGTPWVPKPGDHHLFESITPVKSRSCEHVQPLDYKFTHITQEYK